MDHDNIVSQLRELIVSELDLRGKKPEDIDPIQPLFGSGLSLDSLDALQLGMAVEEHFGVKIPEGEEAHAIFASVSALATFISESKK